MAASSRENSGARWCSIGRAPAASTRSGTRVGPGVMAGSYVSVPGSVTDFVTYGNAVAIAEVNETRIRNLQEQARAARRAQ